MRFIDLLFIFPVLISFVSKDLVGQQAQFETAFYFQDAAGNRDTIIIGADTSANNIVNTHLGEILLTSPWDSAFEVRVAREDNYHFHVWFGEPLYLYNKRITFLFDVPECGYSTPVIFLMYTKHFPVTVTWDKAVWSFINSPCPIDGSFFHHTDEVLEPGWWPAFNFACLGPRSSFEFNTTDNEPYSGIIDSILGKGMEFVYGLQLNTSQLESPISPCYLEVAVDDLIFSEMPKFHVYPNPASDNVTIKLLEGLPHLSPSYNISVYNLHGIEVLKSRFEDQGITLGDLPDGLYFINLTDDNSNYLGMEKIVLNHTQY